MRIAHIALWTLCGFTMIASGCTSYYRVTDPTSGKQYYTTEVIDKKFEAVKIKDDKTGDTVTLKNWQIKEISKDDYKAGIAQ